MELVTGIPTFRTEQNTQNSRDQTKMSGIMLCDDLLEMIGDNVEKKREQESLNHFRNSSRSRHLVQTLNEMRRDLEMLNEDEVTVTMIEMMAEMLHFQGDRFDEDRFDEENPDQGSWYDEAEFWEDTDPYVTIAFLKGSQWGDRH